ncbi:Isopenicillin N epimerase component 1, partial [Bienertia sinuspersici]
QKTKFNYIGTISSNLFNSISNPSDSSPPPPPPYPLFLKFQLNIGGISQNNKVNDVVDVKNNGVKPRRTSRGRAGRNLAMALASVKKATVVEFYSPNCTLCNSLLSLH